MPSACIHEKGISKLFKNFFHPNLLSDFESYKVGTYYLFPTYHGCWYKNRNGTRKKMQFFRGEVCINAVHTACWRRTKKKYLNPKVYNTRYRRIVYKRGFFLSSLLLNWLKIMNVISYLAERQSALNDAEIALTKVCYYCKNCKKCKRFYSIKTELEKKGFFTFNKQIKYWNVRDPESNKTNRKFEVRPIRDPRFIMISRRAFELFCALTELN